MIRPDVELDHVHDLRHARCHTRTPNQSQVHIASAPAPSKYDKPTFQNDNINTAHKTRAYLICSLKCYRNYNLGLRVQTGIKRRKIKNRPCGTECNAVIAEELNCELSLQHKTGCRFTAVFNI